MLEYPEVPLIYIFKPFSAGLRIDISKPLTAFKKQNKIWCLSNLTNC